MRGVLLFLAAAAMAAGPAAALAPASTSPSARSFAPPDLARGVHVHRGHGDFARDDGRAHRRRGGDVFFPYRDYQGDTLWRSDGFNDWWHDRPDRAFPRWVAGNRDCRLYWAGGGWRC